MTDPIRPTDDEARTLARRLLHHSRHAALGTLVPGDAIPFVTRVALGTTREGLAMSLVSSLAQHTRALEANAACSLLIGEPEGKGDPLVHPRLTLQARARLVPRDTPEHAELAAHYLAAHPKARLYAEFTDFRYVVFTPVAAFLNGGFGKAFVLTPEDLAD